MASVMAEVDANRAHLDADKMFSKRQAASDPLHGEAEMTKRPRLTNTIELAEGYTLELQSGNLILHQPRLHPLRVECLTRESGLSG